MLDARHLAPLLGALLLGCSTGAVTPPTGPTDAGGDASIDRAPEGGRDVAGLPDGAGEPRGLGDAARPDADDGRSDAGRSEDVRRVDDAAGDASDAVPAGPYDPCPAGRACRIMPLGDSITDGCCGETAASMGASYRLTLFRLARMGGKDITFVGAQTSGPTRVDGVPFPRNHEGHPGWTIADGGGRDGLQQRVAGWLAATPPDIVALMIGTNDVDIQLDLPNAPKRLSLLREAITKAAPKALVVLAQIVPTRKDDENVRVRAFNAAMPALVKSFTDAGKHVVLVDMYGAFTKEPAFKTKLLEDDLHPTDAGYAVMANVWWGAIGT